MERKEFIKKCGLGCISMAFLGTMLEGCNGIKYVTGTLDTSGMLVPLQAFEQGSSTYRQYVIVKNEKLKFPVCVYRNGENSFTALLMRCTHQGAELQVFGDRLECPAHGSQFSNTGMVKNGPADTNLRTFPVKILKDQIHILLS